jgi:uncharacterized repeat protein (TIGR03803 family)
VVEGIDGNFYGVTPGGGLNTVGPCSSGPNGFGCGTVFKVTPGGVFTSIYSFCSLANCADGASPGTLLLAAADGELYGITALGGASGWGTIFKITLGGKLTTLYSFPSPGPYGGPCLSNPSTCAPLIQANDGNIYGAASFAPNNGGSGMVFKLTPGGTFSTLYSFCSQPNCADGQYPPGVMQGTDGSFYGGTQADGLQNPACGVQGCGTVFRLTGSGALKTLHTFSGADGSEAAGVVQATNGVFYGATRTGGAGGQGTIFAISVGLGPFVSLLPNSGKAGGTVQILGYNLTGATSVSFNGVAASFTVESGTLIIATVPSGATSGFVEVVTPNRTLKSNMRFVLRPKHAGQ